MKRIAQNVSPFANSAPEIAREVDRSRDDADTV
jgi:hypothetical protein